MVVAELFATLAIARDAKSWDEASHSLEHLKHAVEAIGAIEFGKSIAEHLAEAFTGAAEQVETADRLAQSLGTTAAAVQELGYAAQMTHVPAEALQTALQHLALEMANARKTGSGPLVDALGTLGIGFDQIKNKAPDEVLAIFADHIAKLPDGMAKSGAAAQAFGRSGAELIPLLNKGADGIAELRKEAVATGNAIEGPGAEALRGYNDAMLSLHSSVKGLENQLAVALAPTVANLAGEFKDWLTEHHQQIVDNLTSAAKGLAVALQAGIEAVAWLTDNMDVLEPILLGVGTAMLAVAADAAAAWVAVLGPVALIGAGIAAVGVAVFELVKHWDAVKEAAADAWQSIEDGASAAAEWVGGQIEGLYNTIAGWGDSIKGVFTSIGDGIKAAIHDAIDFVTGKIDWVVDKAKGAVDAIEGWFGGDDDDDTSTAGDAAGSGSAFRSNLQNAFGGLSLNGGDLANHSTTASPAAYVVPSVNNASTNTATVAPGAVQINIDAGNANADDVVRIAGREFDTRLATVLRDAHADGGGR